MPMNARTHGKRTQWERKGIHWDLFEFEIDNPGSLEIESCDDNSESKDAFATDEDAVAYVMWIACRVPEGCPDEVVKECRDAVGTIVQRWERDGGQ